MTKQKKPREITAKQKRFCQEYVIDSNATQAAIRAGYSKRTARSQGQRLLTNVDIENYISKLQEDIQERNKITIDECVGFLANMARVDIADFYADNGQLKSIHDIPKESRQAIAELSVFEEYQGVGKDRELIGFTKKVKTTDRKGVIVELMKHLGGYKIDNEQKVDKNPSREERDQFLKEMKEDFKKSK